MKRILFALPIPYSPQGGFWTRDAGLMVVTLRQMGYDAWLIALGDASTETEDKPVLAVSLEDLNRADWWKAQRPDAVVLSTWSAPRYDALRQAALAATPLVVERLDTDGVRSARNHPKAYYIRAWGAYWDNLPAYVRWSAPFLAMARTALFYAFPRLMDARMVATMGRVPALMAESPIAAQRIQQMFTIFSGTQHRIELIPHPVNEEVVHYDGAPKQNQIITVGRWATAQKDFPMLQKVLAGFLQRHPDWRAVVVGSGVPARDLITADSGAEEWRRRITFHEKLTHEELRTEYSRSKIYLMVSRYESFCIAAAEALCCGCSVVGSCTVPTSYYFAETQSGAVAATRTADAFLETLDGELESWNKGERVPATIASIWRNRAGSHEVSRATLALLEEIAPGDGRSE